MAVPNTETFTLQDVTTEIGGGLTSLQACFDGAMSSGFDSAYNNDSYAPANSMLRFRNYNHNPYTVTTTMTQVGSSATLQSVSGGGDVLIEWGDGNSDIYVGGFLSSQTHNYSSSGTYDIIIKSESSLTSLSCFSSNLTALDISNNAALTSLRCFSNNLTALDVNTHLELLDGFGLPNGLYNSGGQSVSAPPSGNGIIAKDNLISKGWTVITD